MKRDYPESRAGFSLVELMMATAASSVLAVVMCGMLMSTVTTWRRTGSSLELQRDMRASMLTLAQMTHAATSTTFTGGTTYTARFSDKSPASIYFSTNSLYFDPNTASAGDTVLLAQNNVNQFAVTITNSIVTIVLRLQNSNDAISNRVVLARRN